MQDLLAEVLAVREHRDAILEDLGRSLSWGEDMGDRLRDFSAEGLAAALIAGIEKPPQEAARYASELYWLPPIPNYFFQRDPLAVVGNRAVRCSMATPARRREPLLTGYVFKHHPRFARRDRVFWFDEFSADSGRSASYARMAPMLEGGDILVLSEDVLAIGYSQRTQKTTIEPSRAMLSPHTWTAPLTICVPAAVPSVAQSAPFGPAKRSRPPSWARNGLALAEDSLAERSARRPVPAAVPSVAQSL